MTELFDFLKELVQSKNPLVTIVIAAFSGAMVRLIDKKMTERKAQAKKAGEYDSEASRIRKEQRESIDTLSEENDVLHKQMDEWRERYWKEVEAHAKTKTKVLRHSKGETEDD